MMRAARHILYSVIGILLAVIIAAAPLMIAVSLPSVGDITEPIVQVSESVAHAQNAQAINSVKPAGLVCFGWDGGLTFSITACIALLIMQLAKLASLVASGAAFLFDMAADLTLRGNIYADTEFLTQGWGLLRDISNIFFIFGLLYIAGSMVLGMARFNTKKALVSILIAAIFVNFSLFFTRVIIDAGNIMGRVFYRAIDPPESLQVDGAPKSIGNALVSHLQPQAFIEQHSELFNEANTQDRVGDNMFLAFIFLLLLVFLIALIFIFISAAMLFIGRIIMLWLLMLGSPLFFALGSLPVNFSKFGLGRISLAKWAGTTVRYAFLVPIFMFFIWLAAQFLGIDDIGIVPDSVLNNTSNAITKYMYRVVGVVIPLLITFFVIKFGLSTSKKMGAEIQQMTQKAASAGLGLAVGGALAVASGGTSLALRQTVGRAAASKGAAVRARRLANSANPLKKTLGKSMQFAARTDYDVRSTTAGKQIGRGTQAVAQNATGSRMTNTGIASFGQSAGKGGFVAGMQKDRQDTKADMVANNVGVDEQVRIVGTKDREARAQTNPEYGQRYNDYKRWKKTRDEKKKELQKAKESGDSTLIKSVDKEYREASNEYEKSYKQMRNIEDRDNMGKLITENQIKKKHETKQKQVKEAREKLTTATQDMKSQDNWRVANAEYQNALKKEKSLKGEIKNLEQQQQNYSNQLQELKEKEKQLKIDGKEDEAKKAAEQAKQVEKKAEQTKETLESKTFSQESYKNQRSTAEEQLNKIKEDLQINKLEEKYEKEKEEIKDLSAEFKKFKDTKKEEVTARNIGYAQERAEVSTRPTRTIGEIYENADTSINDKPDDGTGRFTGGSSN